MLFWCWKQYDVKTKSSEQIVVHRCIRDLSNLRCTELVCIAEYSGGLS